MASSKTAQVDVRSAANQKHSSMDERIEVKLKNATQIINGFPAHLRRKHKGRREVSPKDIEDAQVAYLQKHLEAYYKVGVRQGLTGTPKKLDTLFTNVTTEIPYEKTDIKINQR